MKSTARKNSAFAAGTSMAFGVALAAALLLATPAAATIESPDGATTAAGPSEPGLGSRDPLEPINRAVWEVNRFLRLVLIDPLVDGYQALMPDPFERAISNAVANLTEPITAVASLLQGDGENAATATGRFLVNSTLGLAGTHDPATGLGLEHRPEDLGQAMGSNGIGPGPHLVLPLLGPSNLRDAVGDAVTALTSPLSLAASAGAGAVRYADNQDDIHALEEGALDPYVAEREAYEQYRRHQVANGLQALPEAPSLAADTPLLTPPAEAGKPR